MEWSREKNVSLGREINLEMTVKEELKIVFVYIFIFSNF